MASAMASVTLFLTQVGFVIAKGNKNWKEGGMMEVVWNTNTQLFRSRGNETRRVTISFWQRK